MLTGPAPAARKALQKAGLTIDDIDLFEVNEAFAAVVMRFINELQVPEDKVNVNGGAIAMGHPLGATGAMILGTLLDELERQDKKRGWPPCVLAVGWVSRRSLNECKENLMSAIHYEKNADQIVILTLDSTGQSANTMNAEFRDSLDEITQKLKAETDLKGIIFRSAKKTFFLAVI